MALGDIFKVVIEQTLHNQVVENVLHYYQSDDQGPAGASASLASRVAAIIVPLMKGIQSAELAHTRVIVQKIRPLPPFVPVVNSTAAGPGGVAGESLPTEVTAVLTKGTPFAGRKYRGRQFIAGVPVSSESDSQLSAAALAAWQAAATAMNVTLTDAGNAFYQVINHRATSTFDVVTTITARPVLRSQRRRQIGKGV